jgi:hypothetical protein
MVQKGIYGSHAGELGTGGAGSAMIHAHDGPHGEIT